MTIYELHVEIPREIPNVEGYLKNNLGNIKCLHKKDNLPSYSLYTEVDFSLVNINCLKGKKEFMEKKHIQSLIPECKLNLCCSIT